MGRRSRPAPGVASPWLMFTLVTATIAMILVRGGPLMRVNAVFAGLGVGLLSAAVLGELPSLEAARGSALFVVDSLRWPLSLDAGVIAVLLPIYLVSAVESIGDLTATSGDLRAAGGRPGVLAAAARRRARGRLQFAARGAVLHLSEHDLQSDNGVIRVTGIASRRVGVVLAVMLFALGTLPLVARLFLGLPEAVLAGVTGIMFAMVGVAGAQILRSHAPGRRSVGIAIATVVTSVGLARVTPLVDGVPELVRSVLAFPIASAVVFAIIFDAALPGRAARVSSAVSEVGAR